MTTIKTHTLAVIAGTLIIHAIQFDPAETLRAFLLFAGLAILSALAWEGVKASEKGGRS